MVNLNGRNDFHVRYINLSYRIRGKVARTQINIVAIMVVLITIIILLNIGKLPVKKIVVNSLIIKILAYSAINTNANKPLLYSMLNPDTSSDSPSARSNGVRFVSARFVINHINMIGKAIMEIQEYKFDAITCISIMYRISSALIKISAIDTS